MTLIIEDGTNVANANSYATLVEARAYALARGVTLSTVDATLESQLIQAMDYLEAQRSRYQGNKTYETQLLQWPRANVWIDAYQFSSVGIPQLLKNAQCQLAMEIHNGVLLLPTITDGAVKREKIDVIEVEYLESSISSSAVLKKVDSLLQPLFKTTGFSLGTVRV